jgi:hypothetical protein
MVSRRAAGDNRQAIADGGHFPALEPLCYDARC